MTVCRRKIAPRRPRGSWHDYEYAKQEWRARNPGASCAEYEAAMARIAERLGL